MAGFTLRMERNWDGQVFRSDDTRDACAAKAVKIAETALKQAPKGSHKAQANHWNAIKNNISVNVELDEWGWRANVNVEENPRVRHAMLQERGWHEARSRRWHPGRRFLKQALWQEAADAR